MVTFKEFISEENKPTNPKLWSKAKSLAKSKFDVYPSAYANGWAAKWYKSKGGGWKKGWSHTEYLRKWFSKDHPDGDWKRVDSKGKVVGDCARDDTDGDGKGDGPKPKCMSKKKRQQLSKKERGAATRAKRKHDSNPDRKGKPINVSNFGKGKLWKHLNKHCRNLVYQE